MRCSFCDSPAAHPATGCVYGPDTLACRRCVEQFWAWVRSHTNKRPRKGKGPNTALTFYEAATLVLPMPLGDPNEPPSSRGSIDE